MASKKDNDLIEVVMEALEEDGRISMDYVDVTANNGSVTINGRVASEEQLEIVDQMLQDVLEITDFTNNLWVDDSLDFDAQADEDTDTKKVDLDEDDNEIDDQDYSQDEEDEYD